MSTVLYIFPVQNLQTEREISPNGKDIYKQDWTFTNLHVSSYEVLDILLSYHD